MVPTPQPRTAVLYAGKPIPSPPSPNDIGARGTVHTSLNRALQRRREHRP